jgi:hypothetical protein
VLARWGFCGGGDSAVEVKASVAEEKLDMACLYSTEEPAAARGVTAQRVYIDRAPGRHVTFSGEQCGRARRLLGARALASVQGQP